MDVSEQCLDDAVRAALLAQRRARLLRICCAIIGVTLVLSLHTLGQYYAAYVVMLLSVFVYAIVSQHRPPAPPTWFDPFEYSRPWRNDLRRHRSGKRRQDR